mmetsp:Transcript_67933/g.191491  ORF Transcript_67933/g.191491 Transcript_67933/m.191491 type:complete len:210 (-) Transcript_67933:1045-1674(-)
MSATRACGASPRRRRSRCHSSRRPWRPGSPRATAPWCRGRRHRGGRGRGWTAPRTSARPLPWPAPASQCLRVWRPRLNASATRHPCSQMQPRGFFSRSPGTRAFAACPELAGSPGRPRRPHAHSRAPPAAGTRPTTGRRPAAPAPPPRGHGGSTSARVPRRPPRRRAPPLPRRRAPPRGGPRPRPGVPAAAPARPGPSRRHGAREHGRG